MIIEQLNIITELINFQSYKIYRYSKLYVHNISFSNNVYNCINIFLNAYYAT